MGFGVSENFTLLKIPEKSICNCFEIRCLCNIHKTAAISFAFFYGFFFTLLPLEVE